MNNKKMIGLVLGGMCVLLAYGITVQIKTVNGTGMTASTNATENELRDEVLKAKEKYDNLYKTVEEAEKQLEVERTNATQNNEELTDLENSIKEGNKALGLSEVTGKGVIITLNDNQKISSSNYVGDLNSLIVHDLDIMYVVNELKNAGAEAISINDQRIVSISAIECDGNVIMVNGEKLGAPFEIKAIGLPERLIGVNRVGGYLNNFKEYRRLEVTIKKVEDDAGITIPKYTGIIKFNYAESR